MSRVPEQMAPPEAEPAGPPAGRDRSRRLAAAGLGFSLLLAVVALVVYQRDGGWMYDAKVYRTAGAALLRGLDLYSPERGQHFTYPPFAALVFAPLALLPMPWFAPLWTVLSIGGLEVAVWLCLDWAGVRDDRLRLLLTGAICLLGVAGFEPVSLTLLLGQVNLVLMAAVLLDLWLPDRHPLKGLGIGIAAGVKLIPGLFIVYLLLIGRMRAAAVSGAALAATGLLGLAAAPGSSLRYWDGVFLDSGRVGDPQNVRSQSLQSLLVRWLHTTQGVRVPWLLLSLVVVTLALYLSVVAFRQGDRLLSACACALAAALISPITWQHHWVWMVPMLIWLSARALRDRSPLLLGAAAVAAIEFYLRPYAWGVPQDLTAELHLDVPRLLLSSTYALTGAGVLLLGGLLLRRPSSGRPSSG